MSTLFGLSTLFLLLIWFPASSQQASVSVTESTIQASDTIFRQATNSPGYLVVKKEDWDKLSKVWTDLLRQNEELLIEEQKKYSAKIDSIQQTVVPSNIPEPSPNSENNSTNSSNISTLALSIALIFFIIYSAVITFRLFSQKLGLKSQIDRLDQIEKDFDQHKKNSIERERKLMRELIDAQNELEEEKSRQNHDSE